MVNPFEHIQQKPETAKSLIGVSYEQFQNLVAQVEEYEKQKQEEQEKTKKRINAKGGGRPPKLSIAEKFVCAYFT
ncbi:MAG: DDE transposase family protein [Cyanobacteriota bacterium]|nr:DDE transposase family protein [Cyanobacteriota bacterium]